MFGLQAASQPKFNEAGLIGNSNYTYNNNVSSVRLGQKTVYHQGLMNTHKDLSHWRKDSTVVHAQDRVLPVSTDQYLRAHFKLRSQRGWGGKIDVALGIFDVTVFHCCTLYTVVMSNWWVGVYILCAGCTKHQ